MSSIVLAKHEAVQHASLCVKMSHSDIDCTNVGFQC